MIGVDVASFVRMILLSLLFGACLACVLEILRLIFGFCFPQIIDGSRQQNGVMQFVIAVRDVIFFIISGIAFSVFVYYTNNGNIRLIAVVGTLIGFFVFYFTVGRLFRKISKFIIYICHKVLSVAIFPIKWMLHKFVPLIKSKIHFGVNGKKSKSQEGVTE